MANFDFEGLGLLLEKLRALQNPDPKPLLEKWAVIIHEDNRDGVMAGLDSSGNPMTKVTYRPKVPKGKKPARWTNPMQRAFVHSIQDATGNNLSSTQYRKLGGPPLAPRGLASRVITNLKTAIGYDTSAQEYFAEGAWHNVVSKTGKYFLPYHFNGEGNNPIRDLSGTVRPRGMKRAIEAFENWARDLLKDL